MPEFDLGNTFNYAEMAYLIAPRPFMVERGHDDGVGIDEMVAYEYAKVRYLYAKLEAPGAHRDRVLRRRARDPREGDVRVLEEAPGVSEVKQPLPRPPPEGGRGAQGSIARTFGNRFRPEAPSALGEGVGGRGCPPHARSGQVVTDMTWTPGRSSQPTCRQNSLPSSFPASTKM